MDGCERRGGKVCGYVERRTVGGGGGGREGGKEGEEGEEDSCSCFGFDSRLLFTGSPNQYYSAAIIHSVQDRM